ncbi:MAG TPA: hypothetical protein VGH23_11070 [Rhizomicrobium sp.]
MSWQASVGAGFGGFGLAGIASVLRAGFAASVAAGLFVLAGRAAGLLWAALVALGEAVFGVSAGVVLLPARWIISAWPGMAGLAGQAVPFLSGNIWALGGGSETAWSAAGEGGDPWAPVSPDQISWTLQ